jgi:hypothetical protein
MPVPATAHAPPAEQGYTTAARVPRVVHDVLRGGGRPLDRGTSAAMGARFGYDFSGVRLHTDARAAQSARAVQALAYTVGRDIVFGTGQYRPDTGPGMRVLAHELAHVVQQGAAGAAPSRPATVTIANDERAEREADRAAALAVRRREVSPLSPVPAGLHRIAEPYIRRVSVNLNAPQSASLEWQGTPPATPGSDSFTVSTGKGYSNPGDPPRSCTRDCCSGADVQCAPPHDRPAALGACCTPIGSGFWTGRTRLEHNGWRYWTPVEPVHTSGGRGIALHQHSEVTGEAIGHGCIRMEEANAQRIALYARGRATNVTISGRATVNCPASRACGATGASLETPDGSRLVSAPLTDPDAEPPGPGGGPAGLEPRGEEVEPA